MTQRDSPSTYHPRHRDHHKCPARKAEWVATAEVEVAVAAALYRRPPHRGVAVAEATAMASTVGVAVALAAVALEAASAEVHRR